MLRKILLFIVPVFFAWMAYRLDMLLGFRRTDVPVTFGENTVADACVFVDTVEDMSSIGGVEDIVFLSENWAVGSNLEWDPLVAVHIPTKRVHTLPMGDFPSDVAFWSHGLALHRESLTLAVVNHAWKFGGERIEIFELAFESPEAPPTLRYVKSVVDPKLKYGQINSVALLSAAPLRFYATAWIGVDNNAEGMSKFYVPLTLMNGLFGIERCPLLYCSKDGCQDTGHWSLGWNGIDFNKDRTQVAVVSMFIDNAVRVYAINETHPRELTHVRSIPTLYLMDNIRLVESESDSDTTVWTTAGITRAMLYLEFEKKVMAGAPKEKLSRVPAQVQKVTVGTMDSSEKGEPEIRKVNIEEVCCDTSVD